MFSFGFLFSQIKVNWLISSDLIYDNLTMQSKNKIILLQAHVSNELTLIQTRRSFDLITALLKTRMRLDL